MQKLPLSLVVITLNEEHNIERCLRSVPWASEILVVDSFSSDKTVPLAEKCGARVLQEKWRGYGPQKEWAVQQATYDWILSLDADEALSPELSQEIINLWPRLEADTGYLCPRKSFHFGRWILHGGWYPDYQLRLFNRIQSQWTTSTIHEKVKAKLEIKLKSPILHWVFHNFSDQVLTNDKYSSLQAQELNQRNKKFLLSKLIIKPMSKFFETYFWKLGFLDGLPGFMISVSAAYSVFMKWGKLWEIERSQDGQSGPKTNS